MGNLIPASSPMDPAEELIEDQQQSAVWADRLRGQRFFNDNSEQKENKWGYDLYPERRKKLETNLIDITTAKQGKEYFERLKCEKNVFRCLKTSPLVKLMAVALESSGWLAQFCFCFSH